jgi:hypothetical protein
MQDSYERYREYQGNRREYEMEQFTAPIVGILFTAIITKFWWVIIGGIVVLIMIRLWRKFFGGKAKKNVANETIKNEKVKEESKNMKSTEKGYVNDNNQRNNGRTNKPGTDYGQWFYEMECLNSNCGHKYYANGTDIWLRKCPKCQGGRP